MPDRKDPRLFIPLCREQAHLQRERVRTQESNLSPADIEFLRKLKIKQ